MNNTIKNSTLTMLLSGIILLSGCTENNYAKNDIDLNRVLDITVNTLQAYDETINKESNPDSDQAFWGLAEKLAANYNNAQPKLYEGNIGVLPQKDASILAYVDSNANNTLDRGTEDLLYKIEIDGDNARVIASSNTGEVQDRHFSGGGMMTGFLMGSLLSRQSSAGVNRSNLAGKRTVSAGAARSAYSARSRAGSGSHASGK